MPWLGRPFVGARQLRSRPCATPASGRRWRTRSCSPSRASPSSSALGCVLALAMNRAFRGRGAGARRRSWCRGRSRPSCRRCSGASSSRGRPGSRTRCWWSSASCATPPVWFIRPTLAWVPVVLADVWKTTPFVALLLLAGPAEYRRLALRGRPDRRRLRLAAVPPHHAAAAQAGAAGRAHLPDARRLPRVRPDLRHDRRRPGTSTEPIALYTFNSLLQNLRFGYGSALSVIVFAITFALALGYIRLLGAGLTETRP